MRKLVMVGLIVPMAVLMLASVSLAADENKATLDGELNSDLTGGTVTQDGQPTAAVDSETALDSGTDSGEVTISSTGERGDSRASADRRGRQSRRGQTIVTLGLEQGKKGNDEGNDDEDEDEGNETTVGN